MPDSVIMKKSILLWLALAMVIIVVLGGAYYFMMMKQSSTTTLPTPTTQTQTAPSNNIYQVKTDSTKGAYLTDFAGMTLYIYSKDTTGVSNCSGGCAAAWPPYSSGATAQKTLPNNISVITRVDGSKQFTWKGMPLYYFQSDTAAGQITGDGVNGFNLAK